MAVGSFEDQEGTANGQRSGEQDDGTYALCTCKNGKLFAVDPDDNCRASLTFCNEPSNNEWFFCNYVLESLSAKIIGMKADVKHAPSWYFDTC